MTSKEFSEGLKPEQQHGEASLSSLNVTQLVEGIGNLPRFEPSTAVPALTANGFPSGDDLLQTLEQANKTSSNKFAEGTTVLQEAHSQVEGLPHSRSENLHLHRQSDSTAHARSDNLQIERPVGPVETQSGTPTLTRDIGGRAGAVVEAPPAEARTEHPAEKHETRADAQREVHERAAKPVPHELTTERSRLMHDVESHITNPRQREQFKHNMEEFERRAKEKKLSPEEIAKTYSEISRLLELKGDKPLNANERVKLAELIVDHAAHPTTIDQGDHATCNVTTIQAVLYGKEPSVVAKVLTDVAATGKYTAPDGTSVWLDTQSLRPDSETSKAGQKPDARTYDTQLFNLVAGNLFYAKTNPNWHLEQRPVPLSNVAGDTGERIFDYSTTPPKLLIAGKDKAGHDVPESFAGMKANAIGMVYKTITGRQEADVVLDHADNSISSDKHVTTFKNEAEFLQKLTQLNENNQFPIIVSVNTTIEPFWTALGGASAGGDGTDHVVTITGFQPGPPPKVAVDNQWGTAHDHVSPDKMINVHDLYLATPETETAGKVLAAEAKSSREQGQLNAYAELESVRLLTGDPEQVGKIMADADQHWEKQKKDGTFDEKEHDQVMKKFHQMYDSYPPIYQLQVLTALKDNGNVMGRAEYNKDVALVGAQMLQTQHPYGTELLKEILTKLPKDQRVIIETQIRTHLKQWTQKH